MYYYNILYHFISFYIILSYKNSSNILYNDTYSYMMMISDNISDHMIHQIF